MQDKIKTYANQNNGQSNMVWSNQCTPLWPFHHPFRFSCDVSIIRKVRERREMFKGNEGRLEMRAEMQKRFQTEPETEDKHEKEIHNYLQVSCIVH